MKRSWRSQINTAVTRGFHSNLRMPGDESLSAVHYTRRNVMERIGSTDHGEFDDTGRTRDERIFAKQVSRVLDHI